MAAMVGIISLSLPLILLLGSVLGACYYDSISHYYYARFWGGVFSASLVFIGSFLIAYSGENRWENRLATLAGLCALSNALFPASHSGCEKQEFDGRAFLSFQAKSVHNIAQLLILSEKNIHIICLLVPCFS